MRAEDFARAVFLAEMDQAILQAAENLWDQFARCSKMPLDPAMREATIHSALLTVDAQVICRLADVTGEDHDGLVTQAHQFHEQQVAALRRAEGPSNPLAFPTAGQA